MRDARPSLLNIHIGMWRGAVQPSTSKTDAQRQRTAINCCCSWRFCRCTFWAKWLTAFCLPHYRMDGHTSRTGGGNSSVSTLLKFDKCAVPSGFIGTIVFVGMFALRAWIALADWRYDCANLQHPIINYSDNIRPNIERPQMEIHFMKWTKKNQLLHIDWLVVPKRFKSNSIKLDNASAHTNRPIQHIGHVCLLSTHSICMAIGAQFAFDQFRNELFKKCANTANSLRASVRLDQTNNILWIMHGIYACPWYDN